MHTPEYALLLSGGNQSLVFGPSGDLTMETPGNNTLHTNRSDPYSRNEEVAQIEIMILSITFVVAVVGNVSVPAGNVQHEEEDVADAPFHQTPEAWLTWWSPSSRCCRSSAGISPSASTVQTFSAGSSSTSR
ncbi:hypothetical protein KUCAC02_021053 [Chaenocephalus aceratus]|uniref:Uncharacterized protein n=1 Tax=Chaenocephalus aceratus TaxID=36190 RepID=A0ACB9XFA0_CHAAC|nr:hypothetical protein KUCAC02_021053 [Chaenocephalus aceratus]